MSKSYKCVNKIQTVLIRNGIDGSSLHQVSPLKDGMIPSTSRQNTALVEGETAVSHVCRMATILLKFRTWYIRSNKLCSNVGLDLNIYF